MAVDEHNTRRKLGAPPVEAAPPVPQSPAPAGRRKLGAVSQGPAVQQEEDLAVFAPAPRQERRPLSAGQPQARPVEVKQPQPARQEAPRVQNRRPAAPQGHPVPPASRQPAGENPPPQVRQPLPQRRTQPVPPKAPSQPVRRQEPVVRVKTVVPPAPKPQEDPELQRRRMEEMRRKQEQAARAAASQDVTAAREVYRQAVEPFRKPAAQPVSHEQVSRVNETPLEEPRFTVTRRAARVTTHQPVVEKPVPDKMTPIEMSDMLRLYPNAGNMPVFGGFIPPAIKKSPRKGDSAAFAHDKELVFRHELKFYINYRDYLVLRNALKATMHLDSNAQADGGYLIRSLYFDDMYERALTDKLGGSDHRCKYRVRIYNYSDRIIRFEKKIKEGQYIAKKSISITRKEYDRIMAGHPEVLLSRPEPFARELYIQFRQNRLAPKVVVDYRREAYVMDYERVRITFDKDLRSGHDWSDLFDPNAPVMPMLPEGMMVLEVKFNKNLPDHIRGLLQNLEAPQRSAVSKYVICRKYE